MLTVASIDWAKEVEQRLTDETKTSEERVDSLASFNLQQIDDLNASANQVLTLPLTRTQTRTRTRTRTLIPTPTLTLTTPSPTPNASANQVAGKLGKLERGTFVALMTGDVHNRDIVTLMAKEKVDTMGSFTWQMQLRFYWDEAVDDCVVRQVNSATPYPYS